MSSPSNIPPATVSGAPATPPTEPKTAPLTAGSFVQWLIGGTGILSVIFWLVFSYGAAKLSYDKYRSMGWAILDFFFSYYYYPYYALVLNSPTQAMIAAGRRR